MMQSSNPTLATNPFEKAGRAVDASEAMTIQGTANKTLLLLLCCLLTAGYTWNLFLKSGNASALTPWLWIGGIGGFILALVTVFKMQWAPVTAPLYAAFEGLFVGGISSVLEAVFPGIVIQAVALTFGTLAIMLLLYQSGIIKATEKFKLGVFAATGAIALFYLVSIVLSFFGVQIPLVYGNGWFGIGFSVIVVIVAALNLVIDFDFIEKGAEARNVPKYMEWYGAFALMVTLIWLYLEILRLLSKVRSR